MLVSGDYFVPHLNGDIYRQKPPLQFWAIALAATLRGGLDEVAVRLPAALAAILTILLVFQLGRRLFDRRAAWLAALVFATCSKTLWQGRVGQIDMLLVFWVTLGMYCWVRAYCDDRPGFYRGFFLATGCATVAKGLVGLLPPLLAIGAFLLITRDRATWRAMRPASGLLLWLLPILAWLLPATLIAGPDYLRYLLVDQSLKRYADPWHHFQPWYYYLSVLPVDFFPWALFLPATGFTTWRRLDGRERKGFLFCLAWAMITLLFFSLSPAKRTVYIFSMYPALALLVGSTLRQLGRRWPAGRWWTTAPVALLGLLLGAVAIILPFQAHRWAADVALLGADLPRLVSTLVGLLAAALLIAAVLAWRGRLPAATAVVGAGMGALALGAVLLVMPRFDATRSARPLAERLVAEMGAEETYAFYTGLEPAFLFYTERYGEVLRDETSLRVYLARPGRQWVIAEKRALAALSSPLPTRQVASDLDERDGYVLLVDDGTAGAASQSASASAASASTAAAAMEDTSPQAAP